jgi:phosphoribosylaminoimidazolecarboxamide formyltransferase/IMP cyclohydrolase
MTNLSGKKYALISVSDKTGVDQFARELVKLGYSIISTGGTYKFLLSAGVPAIEISEYTGFPEMLDGRVKTLHPKIHGGLLGRTHLPEHQDAMDEHEINPIDIVVVNLYPFKETITTPGKTYADAIENIDIGGPSMVRSAAKNHERTNILVDPADYNEVLGQLQKSGETTLETRKKLATKAFSHTAYYDSLISNYLNEQNNITVPSQLTLGFDAKITGNDNQPYELRYGENPQQKASFYQAALPTSYSIASAKQLHGKLLSYNNIKDADAAIRILRDFLVFPTSGELGSATEKKSPSALGVGASVVVALKHMNPCGIGRADTLVEAYTNCYESDPVSIFGGIVVLSETVDKETALEMSKIFLEIIIAPGYSAEALEIFTKKKNLRLLQLDFSKVEQSFSEKEFVSVLGGAVFQDQDTGIIAKQDLKVATKLSPTPEQLDSLEFANLCVRYIKSNAIVITNGKQILGVGAGQTNRVDSVKIAIDRVIQNFGAVPYDAVLASDAFFPFADNIEVLAEPGIRAVVQPGGSVRDDEVIAKCDELGIAMMFTGVRNFRH